jgi:acetyl esterase
MPPDSAREGAEATPSVDPELVEGLASMPVLDLADVAAARGELAAFLALTPQQLPAGVRVWADVAARPGGGTVPVRIYRHGATTTTTGALLWFHGGGFVLGAPDMDDAFCGAIAAKLGLIVISVDYRLAPEHPYPAAVDDCSSALRWLVKQAERLDVDPARIAVGGQSAGGGLAAATALRARADGHPDVAAQLLIEPVLDVRLATPSMRDGVETPIWNLSRAQQSWRLYLGGREPTPYASPALADDLRGLPPCYLRTNELDSLRDEGIEYARRLLHAGVSVELHSLPGTFHGFGAIGTAAISRRARSEVIEVLRSWLFSPEARNAP